jgi:hypothetical protein
LRNKTLTAKLSAFALFLTAVISSPAFGATQNSEFGRDWSKLLSVQRTQAIATSASGAIVYRVGEVSRYGGFDVFRSSDYGITWENVTNEYIGSNGSQIAVSDDGSTIVITQYQGYIWISRDFGNSWDKKVDVVSRDFPNFYSPGGGNWTQVEVSATGQRIVVSEYKHLYISNDFGQTFSSGRDVTGDNILDCGMSDDGSVILIGTNGAGVFISKDYGASFSAVTSLPSGNWFTVAVSGDGNHLLAAAQTGGPTVQTGEIRVSSDSAVSWSESALPQTVQKFDRFWHRATISNSGSRIVVIRYSSPPLTSDDFGATFTERNTIAEAPYFGEGITSSADSSRIYAFGGSGVYTSYFEEQLNGLSNSGTVTFTNICPTDTSIVTSVQAQSVLLVLDTATVASDTSTYHYYTETNTALWGATYDYGTKQAVDCSYLSMTGSMTLDRGPFIASSGASYSETSTPGANSDFIQYIGNLNETGTVWTHTNACGNTNVTNLNVANKCDFSSSTGTTRQFNWPALSQGTPIVIRTGVAAGTSLSKTASGLTTGLDPATVFVIVKAKKTLIAAAPARTSWVATETFTVTSA